MFRKCKESVHMACVISPINQPSLEISPVWILLINEEVSTIQGKVFYYPLNTTLCILKYTM
jgi:hypothetical protein